MIIFVFAVVDPDKGCADIGGTCVHYERTSKYCTGTENGYTTGLCSKAADKCCAPCRMYNFPDTLNLREYICSRNETPEIESLLYFCHVNYKRTDALSLWHQQ